MRLTVIADRRIEAPNPASFNVVEGPCEVLQGGTCVGRPSGYSDSESCTILAPTPADGVPSTLSACPVFVTEAGYDTLNIDDIDYHGTNCPTEICVDVSPVGVTSHIPTAPHELHVYSYLFDGQPVASSQLDASLCGDVLCPVNFFAIGAQPDGTAPFPLPLHRLRVFEGALSPSELDTSGLLTNGDLLRYQPQNSRSVKLSRGTDALEITWDTIGWNAATHDQVHATLDYLGGVRLRCDNVSWLWDRAVASTGAIITGNTEVHNWTSSMLASAASIGLRVHCIDSDPCFDMWDGVTFSLSDWPVGTDGAAPSTLCLGRI